MKKCNHPTKLPLQILAVFITIFAAKTIYTGGTVLFVESARGNFGHIIFPIVWLNFTAAFFYPIASYGMWNLRPWTPMLSMIILGINFLIGGYLSVYLLNGGAYEMRTLYITIFRILLWSLITLICSRKIGFSAKPSLQNV